MSNAPTTSAGLPAELTSMATGLAASVNTAGEGASGYDLYAKMGRDGVFVYGADNTEFEPGARWALNPLGIYHGLVAWGDKSHGTEGQNLGEVLVPASQPMPQEADQQEVKGAWSKLIALQLRCVSGEDEGTQVLFKSNSYGGRKAYAALVAAVVARITAGEEAIVPILDVNVTVTPKDNEIKGAQGREGEFFLLAGEAEKRRLRRWRSLSLERSRWINP